MKENPTDPDLIYLLDIFTGADGGIGFVNLRNFIEALKNLEADGDEASVELIKIFRNFTQLARVAQDPKYKKRG